MLKKNTRRLVFIVVLFFSVFVFISFFNVIKAKNIVFPDNRVIYYKTMEYDCTVFTNNLGFRDRNFHLKKDADKRIVVIGDSFTYGWGVNLDDTWAKILERDLQNKEYNVEILNLGHPAGNTYTYKEFLKKALPLLKPDYLIIAIEQGGDLAQLYPYCDGLMKKQRLFSGFKKRNNLVPNIFSKKIIMAKDIRALWQKGAQSIIDRDKNHIISDRIRRLIVRGDLNPALPFVALNDRLAFFYGFADDNVSLLLKKMMFDHLKEIKKMADRINAKTIVILSPTGVYVSKYQHEMIKEQGFILDPKMLISKKQDLFLEQVCEDLGISFYTFTDEFRDQDIKTPLFYKYDGHFNCAGHSYLADLIGHKIKNLINNNKRILIE